MEFTSFAWISEFVSFTLQLYCYHIFKGRKSLRLLMAVLCIRNVISVATHTLPWPYFYQLYLGSILTALIALWAVADVSCYPDKPKIVLRVPVAFAALLAIPYSPFNPANGPGELEQYRLFCLALGLFILALHTIFLIVAHQSIALQLLLLATLAVEATASAGILKLGYHPNAQMFCWWIGLTALGSFSASRKSLPHPALPAVLSQMCASAVATETEIRLPLQSELQHARVYERFRG